MDKLGLMMIIILSFSRSSEKNHLNGKSTHIFRRINGSTAKEFKATLSLNLYYILCVKCIMHFFIIGYIHKSRNVSCT